MRRIKISTVFFIMAIVTFALYLVVGISRAIPRYSTVQFLFRNMGEFLILAFLALGTVLRQYRKLKAELLDDTKRRNINIFTMVLILIVFVGLSVNLNQNIEKDGVYPGINKCDYYDRYSNEIIGGLVQGTCPSVTVVQNSDTSLELSFSEEYEGFIGDDSVFDTDLKSTNALYNRFGVVTITYLDDKILTYELNQSILITFFYDDQERYSYESGKYTVSNTYGDVFTSVRSQYYIREFLDEVPLYDIQDYYDYSLLSETSSVLEVKGEDIKVNNELYLIDHNPIPSENSVTLSGEFITKEFSTYDDFSLLTNWKSTIFTTEKVYRLYANPFTNDIHVEETAMFDPNLYIIKPTSFGYCLEDRVDYGFNSDNNVFLLNNRRTVEYGYLKYESFLETKGIFSGRIILDNNPIMDYINYN
jgi:hypothetical protein